MDGRTDDAKTISLRLRRGIKTITPTCDQILGTLGLESDRSTNTQQSLMINERKRLKKSDKYLDHQICTFYADQSAAPILHRSS